MGVIQATVRLEDPSYCSYIIVSSTFCKSGNPMLGYLVFSSAPACHGLLREDNRDPVTNPPANMLCTGTKQQHGKPKRRLTN